MAGVEEPKLCAYEKCDNPMPTHTRFGRKLSPGRAKKQKYCCDSCARKQALLEKQRAKEETARVQHTMDAWLVRSAECGR